MFFADDAINAKGVRQAATDIEKGGSYNCFELGFNRYFLDSTSWSYLTAKGAVIFAIT